MKRFSVKTVGVSHQPGYPENLIGLMRRADEGWTQRLILMADDENPVDDMAVMVVLDKDSLTPPDAPGMRPMGHDFIATYQLGHLPALVAARVRPDLEEWKVDSWEVLVVPSRPQNPGLDIVCSRHAA